MCSSFSISIWLFLKWVWFPSLSSYGFILDLYARCAQTENGLEDAPGSTIRGSFFTYIAVSRNCKELLRGLPNLIKSSLRAKAISLLVKGFCCICKSFSVSEGRFLFPEPICILNALLIWFGDPSQVTKL